MSVKINGVTLDYLKRQAKKLKKDTGIKHTEALEKTAIYYGFKSYKHCDKQFKELQS